MTEVECSRKIPGLEGIRISPEIWSSEELEIQPGDLSKFVPYGNGFYGYQRNPVSPIKSDPPQEPSGGFVYFDNGVSNEDFQGFLRMMNVNTDWKDYAAFVQDSSNPLKDRFFRQMRIVSKFGLRFVFGAIDNGEYESFKEQKLSVGESLWNFIESEKQRWGTSFMNSKMAGKCGGDGHFACEDLSFGFAMENKYHSIYRIWSRAWLVTK